MSSPLDAGELCRYQDAFLAGGADAPTAAAAWWSWIAENHRCNAALWQAEDRARRDDLPPGAIVQCKREIDVRNQRRNDAMERIDDALLAVLADRPRSPEARRSSETAGAMVDRLSILALKIHHMRRQAERQDADDAHRAACAARLARLEEQRRDLADSLDALLRDAADGRAWFKTYRQFKMYNDPALNPELQAARRAAGGTAAELDVLIPTFQRAAALAVTLAGLAGQSLSRFRVVVSDQSEAHPAFEAGEVQAVLRVLRARGCEVETHRHLPRRGLAEHRDFLLSRARAPYALFLDDDVIVEPDLLERLLGALREQGCGFVGSALIGLSHAADERPHQQHIELWDGPVRPETIRPGGPEWARHHLHSAANLYHVQRRMDLGGARQRLYRVAWVGGCVLYDAEKLRAVGGFRFWQELPKDHCGEDVLAQLRVMARYGGCGLVPSGAYHQELPTTVPCRDADAPLLLPVDA